MQSNPYIRYLIVLRCDVLETLGLVSKCFYPQSRNRRNQPYLSYVCLISELRKSHTLQKKKRESRTQFSRPYSQAVPNPSENNHQKKKKKNLKQSPMSFTSHLLEVVDPAIATSSRRSIPKSPEAPPWNSTQSCCTCWHKLTQPLLLMNLDLCIVAFHTGFRYEIITFSWAAC